VSFSAGMSLGLKADKWFAQKAVGVDFTYLPTTLIGKYVIYLKCMPQSSHAPKVSNVASKVLSMLSKISILLQWKRNLYVPPLLFFSIASNN
jgi:hypothetical protein